MIPRQLSFTAAAPPLHHGGVLPLGPMTVLLGANDTGKTSLLRLLADILAGLPASASLQVTAAPFELEALGLDAPTGLLEAAPTESGLWRYTAGDAVVESDLPLLPEAVSVPTGLTRLGEDVAQGVDGLRGALAAADHQDGAARVDALVSEAVTAALPPFVRDAYRVRLRTSGAGTDFSVLPAAGGAPFGLDAIAQGYLLWVQLAIYDTLDRVERQAVHLEELVTRAPQDAREHARRIVDDGELDRDPPSPDTVTLPGDPLLLRRRLALLQPRAYLIDEPEQHLHPAACRQAQAWLASRMNRAREVAVLATHHPAFLTGDEHTRFVHLDRMPPAGARLQPFDACELERVGRRAAALGYDRGELFALLRGVLLVEGWHDEALLSGLMADELRALRIVIEPVGGTGSFASGDLGLVARLTRVPLAVLVDGVPPRLLASLVANPDAFDRPARQTDPHAAYRGELDALRGLLRHPRAGMTRPRLCALPAADVLDLLDAEARALLQQTIAAGRPQDRRGLLTRPPETVAVKELLKLVDQDERRRALHGAAQDQYRRRGVPTVLRPLVADLEALVRFD